MNSQRIHVLAVRQGFTLVELLVSIALVLLIMVGVNEVFRITSDSVGAGQAISAAVRDARAAQGVIQRDMFNFAYDSPAIIIANHSLATFRTQQDFNNREITGISSSNSPNSAFQDIASAWSPNSDGTIIRTSLAQPGPRIARTDIFSFFTRDLQRRQTGNQIWQPTLSADQSAGEAWIWYGHLRLPNNGNTMFDPGFWISFVNGAAAQNTNNAWSSQFILGRRAILLRPRNPDLTIRDRSGTPQDFYDRPSPSVGEPSPSSFEPNPLQYTAPARVFTSGSTFSYGDPRVQSSRYDLAATDITQFRGIAALAITSNNRAQRDWSLRLHDGRRWNSSPYPQTRFESFWPSDDVAFASMRPMNPARFSQQAPFLLRNCTQFIVEYAGDFLRQDAAGNILAACWDPSGGIEIGPTPASALIQKYRIAAYNLAGTDGVVDFVIPERETPGGATPDNPVPFEGQRIIRWYGYPRDALGSGSVPGYKPGRSANMMYNVVPFRDVVRTLGGTYANVNAPWEVLVPTGTGGVPVNANAVVTRGRPNPLDYDYAGMSDATANGGANLLGTGGSADGLLRNPDIIGIQDPGVAGASPELQQRYVAAWSPYDTIRPKMIRITIVVDDPSARTPEGQTFEMIFNLP